jgi:hypothetical protein
MLLIFGPACLAVMVVAFSQRAHSGSGLLAETQFTNRVSAVLANVKSNPIHLTTHQSPTSTIYFGGVEDGVMRAVVFYEAQRPFLTITAVAEIQDPARAKEMFESWQVLIDSGQLVQAAREALDRHDLRDYQGRTAFLWTCATLFSSVEESELSEILRSPQLNGFQKDAIYASYKSVKSRIGKNYDAGFWAALKLEGSSLGDAK